MLLQSRCQSIQILHQHCVIHGLGRLHCLLRDSIEINIAVRLRCRCCLLLQPHSDHAVFLIDIYRFHLVRFQILQEFGIGHLRALICAEYSVVQHQRENNGNERRQDHHQRAGSLRRTVPASVTVIAIASVAVITAAGCSVAGTIPVII